jgi:hypothetical protein
MARRLLFGINTLIAHQAGAGIAPYRTTVHTVPRHGGSCNPFE